MSEIITRYSASTRGFYRSDIPYRSIPEDLVEIPEDIYRALLSAQSKGAFITAAENGRPLAVSRKDGSTIDVLSIADEDSFHHIPDLQEQAQIAMAWVHQQAALASAMGHQFGPAMKEYVTDLQKIIEGENRDIPQSPKDYLA